MLPGCMIGVPWCAVAAHCVEDREQLAGNGRDRDLRRLAALEQTQVHRTQGWVAARSDHRCHIEHASDRGASTVDAPTPTPQAAVVGEWCDSNKLRDLAAIPLTQFGQLRHGNSRHDFADTRKRATFEKRWMDRARGKHASPSEDRSPRPQLSAKRFRIS